MQFTASLWICHEDTNQSRKCLTHYLREKFIYGWSDGVNPGDTGGSSTHTHICQSSGTHTHHYSGTTSGPSSLPNDMAGGHSEVAIYHTHTYSGDTESAGEHAHIIEPANSLPPYYKLAFIMKL